MKRSGGLVKFAAVFQNAAQCNYLINVLGRRIEIPQSLGNLNFQIDRNSSLEPTNQRRQTRFVDFGGILSYPTDFLFSN